MVFHKALSSKAWRCSTRQHVTVNLDPFKVCVIRGPYHGVKRDATDAKNNASGVLEWRGLWRKNCRVDLRSPEKHLESYIYNLTLSPRK